MTKAQTTLNMAKWILALRSGRYKQGKSALRKSGEGGVRYCCLGVACTISRLGKWVPGSYPNEQGYRISEMEYDQTDLPPSVQKWLGLEAEDNPLLSDSLAAIAANDVNALTFAQIADALEARYLGGKKAKDIVARAKARAVKAQMRESTAWRILAEEHDAGRTSKYLCLTLVISDYWQQRINAGIGSIPADVRNAMISRIEDSVGHSGGAYEGVSIAEDEARQARVLACLMFAEVARDEEKAR